MSAGIMNLAMESGLHWNEGTLIGLVLIGLPATLFALACLWTLFLCVTEEDEATAARRAAAEQVAAARREAPLDRQEAQRVFEERLKAEKLSAQDMQEAAETFTTWWLAAKKRWRREGAA